MPSVQGPPEWSAVEQQFRQVFPSLDVENMRLEYERARSINLARQRYRDWRPSAARNIGEFVPFLSSIRRWRENVAASEARTRIVNNQPEQDYYDTFARHERAQHIRENASFGEELGHLGASVTSLAGEAWAGGRVIGLAGKGIGAVGRLPAVARIPGVTPAMRWLGLAAEETALAGGAVPAATGLFSRLPTAYGASQFVGRTAAQTAVMPSMYLDQWAQNNIQEGRDPMDITGLPAPFVVGMVQTALLGSIGRQLNARIPGRGIGPTLTRVGLAGPVGLMETQIADTLTSAAHLSTGYGPLGEVFEAFQHEGVERYNRLDSAWWHAVTTAVTFAAFAGLHEIQREGTPRQAEKVRNHVMETALETTQRLAKQGVSRERAGEVMGQEVGRQVQSFEPFEQREQTERPVEQSPTMRVESPMTPEQATQGLATEQARMEQAGTPRPTQIGQTGPMGEPRPAPQMPHSKPIEAPILPMNRKQRRAAEKEAAKKQKESESETLPIVQQVAKQLGLATKGNVQQLSEAIRKVGGGQLLDLAIAPNVPVATPAPPMAKEAQIPIEMPPKARTGQNQGVPASLAPPVEKPFPVHIVPEVSIARALEAVSGLHTSERMALEGVLHGNSYRELAELGIVKAKKGDRPLSHESIRKYAESAYQEAKKTNPEAFPHETLAEYLLDTRARNAEALAGLGGERTVRAEQALEESIHEVTQITAEDAAELEKEGRRHGLSIEKIRNDIAAATEKRLAAREGKSNAGQTPSPAGERIREAIRRRQAESQQGATPRITDPSSEAAIPGSAGRQDQAAPVPERPAGGVGEPLPPEQYRSAGGTMGEGPLIRTGTEQRTALAHEVAREDRVKENLAEIEKQASQSDKLVWESVRRMNAKNPKKAAELAKEIVDANGKRGVTTEEAGLLLHRRISVRNELANAMIEADPGKTAVMGDQEFKSLGDRIKDLTAERNLVDRAADLSGSEAGRAFRFRRMFAKFDYSLDSLLMRAEAAAKRPLTPDERTQIEGMANQIEELTKNLEAANAKKIAELQAKIDAYEKQQAERTVEKPTPSSLMDARNEFDAAWKKFNKSMAGKLFSSDPSGTGIGIVAQAAIEAVPLVKAAVKLGVVHVAEFVRRMKVIIENEGRKFPPQAEEALRAAWDKVHPAPAEIVKAKKEVAERTKNPETLSSEAGFRLDQAKKSFDKIIVDLSDDARQAHIKFIKNTLDLKNIFRSLKSVIDFPLLRQGFFATMSHPIRTLSMAPEMVKATFSEKTARQAEYENTHNEFSKLYYAAGGERTSFEDPLTAREEGFASKIVEKIPGIGRVVKGSERGYHTILNRIRVDSFGAMAETLAAKDKLTMGGAKVLANAVNVFSGRGNIHGMEKAANALTELFFAPRWAISRWQVLIGQPLWYGIMTEGIGLQPHARLEIAKEYARFSIGVGDRK